MHARRESFDLALIDLFLESRTGPWKNDRLAWGFEAVKILRAEFSEMIVVIVSGGRSLAFAERGKQAGANATVPKQFFCPKKIVAVIEEGKLVELEASCMPREPMTLARNEWEHLTRVYADQELNATRACDLLGISRSTFYRKLRDGCPEDD